MKKKFLKKIPWTEEKRVMPIFYYAHLRFLRCCRGRKGIEINRDRDKKVKKKRERGEERERSRKILRDRKREKIAREIKQREIKKEREI